jgi:solute carrier family 35 protein F5
MLPLSFIIFGRIWRLWRSGKLSQIHSFQSLLRHIDSHDPDAEIPGRDNTVDPEVWNTATLDSAGKEDESHKLGLRATAKLSLQFCMLWVSIYLMCDTFALKTFMLT